MQLLNLANNYYWLCSYHNYNNIVADNIDLCTIYITLFMMKLYTLHGVAIAT